MRRKQGRMQICLFTLGLCLASISPANIAQAKVAAMDATNGTPIESGTLISSKGEKRTLVDQKNIRIEMAPYSVAEFSEDGTYKLLRGSAMLQSNEERSAETNSARIDFVGTVVLSFDHKERTTSAFVVEGQARMKNPSEPDFSLRLDRGRGAAMVLGDVYPSLVRDISPGQVDNWLKGYAWEAQDRRQFTTAFLSSGRSPAVIVDSKQIVDPNATRLEDYFATVDEERPDLYERRFGKESNADKIVETTKVERKIASTKTIEPEEAALIALPNNNKINLDLGLPQVFASADEAHKDVEKELLAERGEREPQRKIASVPTKSAVVHQKPKRRLDPDVQISSVLERLTALKEERQHAQNLRSGMPAYAPQSGRSPASIESPVPDPVYDFSENF